MPVLPVPNYKPSFLFRNRHINTIYPYLFRKKSNLDYRRERFHTPDHDFVDLDWLRNESNTLVILCHGLEGSSGSQYIKCTAKLLSNNNLDVCALNYRSCSGEMNLTLNMYHSGFTHDLHAIIQSYQSKYKRIFLVGFSLGGNMIMKYLGDGVYEVPKKVEKAVAVSAPCDLSGSSRKIGKWYNLPYQRNFLKTLKQKMFFKQKQFPNKIATQSLSKTKSLVNFDEYFTGPIHGYSGAQDYYDKCNSLQFLDKIKVHTLLIQAKDDPFLSQDCYPYSIASDSDFLHLLVPKYGGHVGFTTSNSDHFWNEYEILKFISQ